MSETLALKSPIEELGRATWARCVSFLADPNARLYEVGRPMSATAPQSPFAEPIKLEFNPTAGLPGTVHAHNGERLSGGWTQQGTHLDALGHFGALTVPWDGKGDFPAAQVGYFGDRHGAQVKPQPGQGLAELGIDGVPPVITSGVVLDATSGFGGKTLAAGDIITAGHLQAMLADAGFSDRGLLPGDGLLIYTGWGTRWRDPDDGRYYRSGPGLGRDAAEWIIGKGVALVALDNPFTDPVASGQLDGAGALPEGVSTEAPFQIHHLNLVQAGVLQIQNLDLSGVVADGVRIGAFLVLPLRIKGASGSPVRPVLIGSPAR